MTEEKENSKDEKKEDKEKDVCCTPDKTGGNNNIFLWLIIIVAIIGAVLFFTQKNNTSSTEAKPVSEKVSTEVKDAAQKLIKENLVAPETKVEIKKVMQESGLYKIELSVDGQDITSYMTKDKTKFIPQLIDTKELEKNKKEEADKQANAPSAEVSNKLDKPEVELFVMSYCPYGTQEEKGILPALDVLGDKVDMKLKFVDYAMHGEKEINENLRQYCIQKNESQKIVPYLKCFLATNGQESDATNCMKKNGVNQAVLTKCIADTDKEYKVTELAKDKSTYMSGQFPQFNVDKTDNEKYGVQGSPTLIVNGEKLQVGRDSASLLKAICSGFKNQPEICKKELSSESPAPGFGTGTDKSGASANAGCGA